MIEIRNLSFSYNPKTAMMRNALRDISFSIQDGDFFGIVGSTGAGKSTLVTHLNALTRIQKNSGTIVINEMDITPKRIDFKKLRKTVGMVFQYPEYQLFADSVAKDVAFGPKNLGIPAEEIDSLVKDAIALVGLDYNEIAERSPFELSGGQKRRVAIAGVLATKPEILVLDEPTAGLDPSGKKEILELIRKVKAECPTIVMISHNMDEVAENCNRIAVLEKGSLLGVFTPRELFSSDIIDKTGLRKPQVTEIADGLNARGFKVSNEVTTEDELVAEIVKRFKEGGNA